MSIAVIDGNVAPPYLHSKLTPKYLPFLAFTQLSKEGVAEASTTLAVDSEPLKTAISLALYKTPSSCL